MIQPTDSLLEFCQLFFYIFIKPLSFKNDRLVKNAKNKDTVIKRKT